MSMQPQVESAPAPASETFGPEVEVESRRSSRPHSSRGPRSPRTNLLLFAATMLSVFHAGAMMELSAHGVLVTSQWQAFMAALTHLHWGWTFAVPLMSILLTHEFGHYFAAKYHRVPASLPYFIPLPALGMFGTMGAVISMPERIRSRNALLDIGAAGPIAGLVVAIPVLIIGLLASPVREVSGHGLLEGQCLLYSALKYAIHGHIPATHDVFLTNTALAGWVGLLITMLNLIPIGQLDGGHIAYALFGEKHNRIAGYLHKALLGVFAYNLVMYRSPVPGMVWIVWFGLLFLLKRFSGDMWHPPTDLGQTLSPGRRAIAVGCILLFVLLFMPTPMREY